MRYRTGTRVRLNVYDGDRPMCQCHCDADAEAIVNALNARSLIADQPKPEPRAITVEEMRKVAAGQKPTPDCSFGVIR